MTTGPPGNSLFLTHVNLAAGLKWFQKRVGRGYIPTLNFWLEFTCINCIYILLDRLIIQPWPNSKGNLEMWFSCIFRRRKMKWDFMNLQHWFCLCCISTTGHGADNWRTATLSFIIMLIDRKRVTQSLCLPDSSILYLEISRKLKYSGTSKPSCWYRSSTIALSCFPSSSFPSSVSHRVQASVFVAGMLKCGCSDYAWLMGEDTNILSPAWEASQWR